MRKSITCQITVNSTRKSKPVLALKRAKPGERLRKQQQNLINRFLRESPETWDLWQPWCLQAVLPMSVTCWGADAASPTFSFLISLRKALQTGIETSLVQWSAAMGGPQMLERCACFCTSPPWMYRSLAGWMLSKGPLWEGQLWHATLSA